MQRCIRLAMALAALAIPLAGCGSASDSARPASHPSTAPPPSTAATSAAAPATGAVISSTLDGKRVLPQRLRWRARVKGANISQVAFVIDDSERWVEHEPPYYYGGDDAGANRGFLITTWLAPGRHRFTVRATDFDNKTHERTVTARSLPAPAPPAALAGRWRRPQDGGHWDLIFDRIGAWHLDPEGTGLVNQVQITGDTIRVYAPIQMSPLTDDRTAIKRLGHKSIGGIDCNPAGPFGTYSWKVSGDRLTLRPLRERCPDRKQIWTHTWRRVGDVDDWRAPNL